MAVDIEARKVVLMKNTFCKILTLALVLGLIMPAMPAGASKTQDNTSEVASSNAQKPAWAVKNPARSAWEKKIRLTLKRRGALRDQAAVFRRQLKSNAIPVHRKREIYKALNSHKARIQILSRQLSWTFAHKPSYYNNPNSCNGWQPRKHCKPVSPA